MKIRATTRGMASRRPVEAPAGLVRHQDPISGLSDECLPAVIPKAPTTLTLSTELVEAVRDVIEAATSPNTRRAYNAQWRKYEAWCRKVGAPPLPSSPPMVATFITHMAAIEKRAVASVGVALAAISERHRAARFEFDSRAPEIRTALKGIRRKHARPQRQARALHPGMLRKMVLALGDDHAARRDAALLAILFAGAMRRSEAVGLDWMTSGAGDGVISVDHAAIEITLLRSKARTEPVKIKIPAPENAVLVAALKRWVAIAGIAPGTPLFRIVDRSGVTTAARLYDRAVSRIIKARVADYLISEGYTAEDASVEAACFSGHSGRVGLYVSAAEAGVGIDSVAALARHKSMTVAQRYAREADMLLRAPSKNPALAI